ncbi:MAG: hypothetical protein CL533_04345 [Afipia sp.]|nr:hypothetical protein [Afipia sp.]OUX62339.1 MAG: hypothetical protein CBB64_04325 [Afipia sp. TMED4]HAQ92731.1 hypothetical protein [Afipia sp.]HBF53323.1 hypothetical protein [Afipia sp.]HCX19053.1 hypothetical protein [Afipia sp.]
MSNTDFEWTPENADIIAATQPAIAVYQNQWCQIVIRQEGEFNDDGDSIVFVCRENIPALIAKLQYEHDHPEERPTAQEAQGMRDAGIVPA